jgi:proton translocating ATP synthase F1 alpha subunit
MDLNLLFQQGVVGSYMDSIIVGLNLDRAFVGEVVQFKSRNSDLLGMVMDLEPTSVKIVLIHGNEKELKAGDEIYRTYKATETKAGFGILGRIVDPLGNCFNRKELDDTKYFLDELFNIKTVKMEKNAPSIIEREPVRTPVLTGINAIDTLIPIGAGQRELILGDQGTGKTAMSVTIILNQKRINNNMWREIEKFTITNKHIFFIPCVFVVVGGKRSEQARMKKLLEKQGALYYTSLVFTSADIMPGLQYLAPYAGCAVGEWFRDNGYRALIVYDDSTNHATAYRQLSLLLRRPPGREAYPGDIFYVHAKLLERAAQMSRDMGGGSLTASPIVTTKAGDISGYIPTNIISITDGQIFLSTKLANQGLFPAIDLNLSVSRVGSDAQAPAMKAVSKQVKVDYSMYRSYAGVEKLGGDIPSNILGYINRGKKLVNFFTQDLYETCSLYRQVFSLYTLSEGFADNVQSDLIKYFFDLLFDETLSVQYLAAEKAWYIYGAEDINKAMRVFELDVLKEEWDVVLKDFRNLWETGFASGAASFFDQLKGNA